MHNKKGYHQTQEGKNLGQQQEWIGVGKIFFDKTRLNCGCPLNLEMKKNNYNNTGFDNEKPITPNYQSQQQ